MCWEREQFGFRHNPLGITATKFFNLIFDFGDDLGLDVATMFGTVFLALTLVAIALIYSFFCAVCKQVACGQR
ncbi:hypothetical protein ACX27_06770 [Nostoc piscinale CENA21]|uniref:Uncharacterized protein n=1 Tax=Nostoc piscinale CENA21 TaxID=224013 RepID=A0A0M4T0Q5_9NOSO|nr:hypothetical protein ACX27_06770 [Nostoc piscinale CENA21]